MNFQKFSNIFQLSSVDYSACSCLSCPCNRSVKSGDTAAGASGPQNGAGKQNRINSGSSC